MKSDVVEKIKSNRTYQQILRDSFGGVMYNVANREKYNSENILKLWKSLSLSEKEGAGGIMQGAMNFLQGN